jgi:hypothetical protein
MALSRRPEISLLTLSTHEDALRPKCVCVIRNRVANGLGAEAVADRINPRNRFLVTVLQDDKTGEQ